MQVLYIAYLHCIYYSGVYLEYIMNDWRVDFVDLLGQEIFQESKNVRCAQIKKMFYVL